MGTTWLFNVLQRMIGASGLPLAVVADGVPKPAKSWRGAVLLKSHRADSPPLIREFDSRVNLRGFVMMRDPEATLASLVRTQQANQGELIGWLEADVDSYAQVLPHMRSAVVIREEWIADEASRIVSAVDQFLELRLPVSVQQGIAEELSRERVRKRVTDLDSNRQWNGDFQNFDRLTQWHAGHIGPDGPRTVELNVEEQARIGDLRAQITELTEQFGIWAHIPPCAPISSSATALEFVRARERESLDSVPLRKRLMHYVANTVNGSARE